MAYLPFDGLKIYYEENGNGVPLLLLQGNSASSAHLKMTGDVDYFKTCARVLTFDYRGTGKSTRFSTWSADWYCRCAQDAAMIIQAVQAQPCRVIGSSGGAFIAFWLAILFPELVHSVIAESFRLDFPRHVEELIQQTRSQYSREQKMFWHRGHGWDWRSVVKADTEFLRRLAATNQGELMDIPLKKIQCPVLLCGSARDDMVPDVPRQLQLAKQQISHAELYIHPCGAHPWMWSEPQAFREQANRFFGF